MKKTLKYIPILLAFLWACNPMEDTYNQLDKEKQPYKENISYTLVSADYANASKAALVNAADAADSSKANLIKSQMAFNQRFTAADYVGAILTKDFPALSSKSSAVVTYSENLEDLSYLSNYVNATSYELTDADYQSVEGGVASAGYFIPSSPASENLPAILASSIASPTDNELVLVTYKSSDLEPSTGGTKPVTLFSDDFEKYLNKDTIKLDGWINYIEAGTFQWLARVYSENAYAQMSAYSSTGPSIAWLITPAIDLSGSQNNKLSFDINEGYYTHDGFQVLISDDFDGSDVENATWYDVTSNFTIPQTPTDAYGVLTPAGSLDLSAYTGTIHIGFKYMGDGANSKTTTYQIDNVLIKGVTSSKKSVAADLFNLYNDYYQYSSGKWAKAANVDCIQPVEYEEMGAPGAHNNFSSSILPADYLPQYLLNKYPFAQEGDALVVVYNYYSSSKTSLVAESYNYVQGLWTAYKGIVEKTDQFVHTGTEWIFDPTIHLSPSSSDFQLLVDYVYTNLSRTYGSSYGNDEFYYGASAYYKNFDLRLTNKVTYSIPGFDGLSEEESIALTWERLQEGIAIMLQLKYPDAQTDINGIPIYYWVTFATFENSLAKNTYVGIFKATKAGPDPVFERDTEFEDQMVSDGELIAAQVSWNR